MSDTTTEATAPSLAVTAEPAAAPRRRRPAPRAVEVVRAAAITPHLRRITFGGPGLEGFTPGLPSGHIKLFLPAEGEADVHLPAFTDQGLTFPEGVRRPTVRTYTPRAFRPDPAELDVDFVLHDAGPASRWAATAAPGDRAGIAGPGRGYEPDPRAVWFVIGGDEAALPAIATIVEALPVRATAHVVVEVPDASDEVALVSPATLITTWLPRGDAEPGSLLEAELAKVKLPLGEGRFWVATEAAVVRRIRADLLGRRAIPAANLVTRGYWRAGQANHPDHDYGDD